MLQRPVIFLVLASLALAAVIFVPRIVNQKPPRGPNVIIVSLDTLRADHLSCYGYERDTSPNIDRLAQEGLLFENAFCQESWTLPSHASLFTSLYPDVHGVTNEKSALRKNIPTLAETLKQHGYSTAAFVNSDWLNPRFGLKKGFDSYDYSSDFNEEGDQAGPRSAGQTNTEVFRFLDSPPKEPFFLFVHYYDIHSDYGPIPYDSPPKFMERFCPDCEKEFSSGGEVNASVMMMNLNKQDILLNQKIKGEMIALYDAGIAYTDIELGRLMARLKKDGLFEDSLIIVTSDHGEEFQEHGMLLHEQVYEENIHVPLIMKFPKGRMAGDRASGPAQTIDIMPTILSLIGIEPVRRLQGRDLINKGAASKTKGRFVFSKNKHGKEYAILDGAMKGVYRPGSGEWEFYNLKEDPAEKIDLAHTGSGDFEDMKGRFFSWKKEMENEARNLPAMEKRELAPKLKRSLKALGYLQ